MADVVRAVQPHSSGRIPRHPTDGWMRHELEALGVRTRGLPWTSAQLVAALRARGYDVHEGPTQPDERGR